MARWVRPALLVLLVAAGITVAATVGVPPLTEVRTWVAAAGWAGPVLYAGLFAAASLTPAPASVLTVGAGALFGWAVGTPVAFAGALVGALLAFGMARTLGRSTVEGWMSPAGSPAHISTAQLPAGCTGEPPEYAGYEGRLAGAPSGNLDPPIYAPDSRRGTSSGERLARLDGMLRDRGLLAVIGIRLVPLGPAAMVNAACGLTAVRVRDYVAGTAIGLLPGIVTFVAFGAFGTAPGSAPFLLAVLALVVLIGIGVVTNRKRAGTDHQAAGSRSAAACVPERGGPRVQQGERGP